MNSYRLAAWGVTDKPKLAPPDSQNRSTDTQPTSRTVVFAGTDDMFACKILDDDYEEIEGFRQCPADAVRSRRLLNIGWRIARQPAGWLSD